MTDSVIVPLKSVVGVTTIPVVAVNCGPIDPVAVTDPWLIPPTAIVTDPAVRPVMVQATVYKPPDV